MTLPWLNVAAQVEMLSEYISVYLLKKLSLFSFMLEKFISIFVALCYTILKSQIIIGL